MTNQADAYSVNQIKNEIKSGNVIVYFYLPHCPFCHYMEPHINRIKNEVGDDVRMIKVDVSSDKQAFKKAFNLSTFPTIIYYKDGKKVESHGSQDRRMTAPKMASIVNKTYKTSIAC